MKSQSWKALLKKGTAAPTQEAWTTALHLAVGGRDGRENPPAVGDLSEHTRSSSYDVGSDARPMVSPQRVSYPAARLSSRVAGLFPPGVIAAELEGQGDPEQLYAAERDQLKGAVPSRIREFAAGRSCARCALDAFDIPACMLLRSPDRRPQWPAEVVGSLTHATNFCAAVIGPKSRFRGLGVDAEDTGLVTEPLWSRICVPAELRWLRSLPELQRNPSATLIFCAKEAFYKCLYTVSRSWLDFSDVQIDLDASDIAAGHFVVSVVDQQSLAGAGVRRMSGRFVLEERRLIAGVAWPCGTA